MDVYAQRTAQVRQRSRGSAPASLPEHRTKLGIIACLTIALTGAATGLVSISSADAATTGTWQLATQSPHDISNPAGAVGGDGQLYMVGGYDLNLGASVDYNGSQVYAYNPVTDTWAQRAAMHSNRRVPIAASAPDGSIVAVGGDTLNDSVKAERYYPSTNSWFSMPNMPLGVRGGAATFGRDGRLYVLGGLAIATNSYTGATQIWDPATNTWSLGPDMPIPGTGLAAVTGPDGRIYAIGSDIDIPFAPTTSVRVFDPATGTWTAGPGLPGSGRAQLGAVVGPDQKIYAMGGGANPAVATVSVLDTSTGVWSNGPDMPTGNRGFATAVAPDGRIFTFDGNVGQLPTYPLTRTLVLQVGPPPDTTPPTLTVPASVTTEATSAAGAAVTYSATATDPVDPNPGVACTPAAGSTFPLGTTTVSCTATDAAGNAATGSFTVTVADTTPPTLTVPDALTAEATSAAGSVVTYSAAAADTVDPNPGVACIPASGATFGLGTTSVSCTATDASGNTSAKQFSVRVVDTTAPAVSVPADVTAVGTTPAGTKVMYPAATATDLVAGALTPTCSPAAGTAFPLGTSTVTCTASDPSGNTGTSTFHVSVSYSWSGLLGPVNADGSSVFKAGRTVPVQFALTGASAAVTNASASFSYAKMSLGVTGTVLENPTLPAPTAGKAFQYDPATGQYQYNWSTKGLTAGTYQVSVDLGDGVTHRTLVSLR